MPVIKTVLVTGSNGYIGSLLTPILERAGYDVIGLDTTYFDDPECHFKKYRRPKNFLLKDIRAVTEKDLQGVDAICHLAGLSNDPMGELNRDLTFDINLRASERLARLAKKVGVKKFLFSSSCSVYGALADKKISEETRPDPKTAYALTKIKFEKTLLKLRGNDFCPIILRNATAYGSSPKFRADLVLNNFAAHAYDVGEIKIMSDGTPWRPLIHVEDIARLFKAFLEVPSTKRFCGQIINCGRNEDNFRVKDIAAVVKEAMPNTKITFSAKPDTDARSYKVNFDKIRELLPDFRFRWTLKSATLKLCDDFKRYGLPKDVLSQRHFIRLHQLQYLRRTGRLNPDLFWNTSTTPISSRAGYRPHTLS